MFSLWEMPSRREVKHSRLGCRVAVVQHWLGRQLTDRVSGREDFQQICEDSQVQSIMRTELSP